MLCAVGCACVRHQPEHSPPRAIPVCGWVLFWGNGTPQQFEKKSSLHLPEHGLVVAAQDDDAVSLAWADNLHLSPGGADSAHFVR
eukprot:scaffold10903_cov51-Isochrysis_galbana.AAC.1